MIHEEEGLFLKQRDTSGIWAKLFELPCVESSDNKQQEEDITQTIESWGLVHSTVIENEYQHVLSHQKLHVRFVMADKTSKKQEFQSYSVYSKQEVHELAKPVLIDKFLHDFYF